MLDNILRTGDVAVCIKNTDREILEQNDLCKRICGDCLGERCERGCMALFADDSEAQWKDWGSRVYTNSLIHGEFFDVTLLHSVEHIITFLQPLKEKYDQALAYYRERGLTRREIDVVALTIRGITNTNICESLSISKATLRTHLNNIYRKLRDLGDMPEFMPAIRQNH